MDEFNYCDYFTPLWLFYNLLIIVFLLGKESFYPVIYCINNSCLTLKYYIETSGGRRGAITPGHVLQFVSGTDEEPVLGFELHPSLNFIEVSNSVVPTAHTCSNTLPHATINTPLPDTDTLFGLYDHAFVNAFFGHV